ncbi:MAG TPA: flagellar export protein FliJ [Desulfonatronum sp.]|nr:flagellar export protein FliJ [Desulfonatronum sp.]
MAKPFEFQLEHVLHYRRQQEEQARLELAQAQNAYQAQIRVLDGLRQKVQQAEKHLKSQDNWPSEELWLWTIFRERLLQDIDDNELQLQRLATRVAACRTVLVQRSKELKVLERLKTKQAVEYYAQQKREEQKQLDEMASLRHQYKGI